MNNVVLTLEMFNKMEHGSIMYEGSGLYPFLDNLVPTRWVAKKGGGHDWAIYYHHDVHTAKYVLTHGNKIYTESNIRTLVPCDDEVFKKYRY